MYSLPTSTSMFARFSTAGLRWIFAWTSQFVSNLEDLFQQRVLLPDIIPVVDYSPRNYRGAMEAQLALSAFFVQFKSSGYFLHFSLPPNGLFCFLTLQNFFTRISAFSLTGLLDTDTTQLFRILRCLSIGLCRTANVFVYPTCVVPFEGTI